MSDPAKYRTKDELESYKQQDPIAILKTKLVEAEMLSEEEFSSMDDEIGNTVQESVDFAEESEEPAVDALYEDIFA